jgi:hypothetical protein
MSEQDKTAGQGELVTKLTATIERLKALIKDDAFAISFQSMTQYRKALLENLK